MSEVTEVGIDGKTITVTYETPTWIIVAGVVGILMYAFLIFIMYAWFSDVASHLVYIEGLLQDIHQTIPTPDPTEYI
jgi:hypothetical protein